MLAIMRDPDVDGKRRDAMAIAAAPDLHSKLTAIDPKLNPAAEPSPDRVPITVRFVVPGRDDND
jgi:hypothetical protein